MVTNVQDRTAEFRAVLAQAQKKQHSAKVGAHKQSLLTESQRRAANGSPVGDARGGRRAARSEFAKRAAEIGRGITATMEKLGRLAERESKASHVLADDLTHKKTSCQAEVSL